MVRSENRYPLVSVITPTYNRAKYLGETIESVLGQSYPYIEYIILDDGSTDETPIISKKFKDRIQFEFHHNMGETLTVNKGFEKAKGEILLVVNSDDPIHSTLIETGVSVFADHPELVGVYPDWFEIDEHSRVIKKVVAEEFNYKRMVRNIICIPGPGTMIRRFNTERKFSRDSRYRYVGDFEFWLRFGVEGPFKRIPKPLATHRIHLDSTGMKNCRELSKELIGMMGEFFTRPDLPDEIRIFKKEAMSNAYFDAGIRCAGYSFLMLKYLMISFFMKPHGWMTPDRRFQLFNHFFSLLRFYLGNLLRMVFLYVPIRYIWRILRVKKRTGDLA